jgi:hypothetical protein
MAPPNAAIAGADRTETLTGAQKFPILGKYSTFVANLLSVRIANDGG